MKDEKGRRLKSGVLFCATMSIRGRNPAFRCFAGQTVGKGLGSTEKCRYGVTHQIRFPKRWIPPRGFRLRRQR